MSGSKRFQFVRSTTRVPTRVLGWIRPFAANVFNDSRNTVRDTPKRDISSGVGWQQAALRPVTADNLVGQFAHDLILARTLLSRPSCHETPHKPPGDLHESSHCA